MLTFYFLAVGILYIIYERLVLSPLNKLPGPSLAGATRLVLMYHEFTRTRKQWIHELHLRYGPVVRIAPDEVSFASWDAVKEVYASEGSGYEKTGFYKLFDNYSTMCMFSAITKGPHGERKKIFSDRYAKSYIMQPETVSGIEDRAGEFVIACTENLGKAVDVYVFLHCYALDCITYHLFDPLGTHTLTDAADRVKMKEIAYQDNLTDSYKEYYLTDLIPKEVEALISKYLRRPPRPRRIATQVMNTARRSDVANHTVLSKLLEANLPTKSIASEMLDHAIAGHDTTGDGLCFLMHELSLPRSSAIQEKLHCELAENPSAPIDDLPYLDAVVKEGLRLFSPIPMSLPRRVPTGGRRIGDAYVPGNTIVSCQAYTLHRLDERVFPDPDTFMPERWLESEGVTERNQLFFAFSTGGRGCIGKHLALLEMKMLLREVYSSYRTQVAPEMSASMEQDDQIIASRPKGQQCLLIFEKIA
ncbi:cytochrome P450 [Rhodofomes roseus]|uniref:Cytochrome P450 n=1 Tax=Rhodofomes roseus TaxID=34475 RepID=A0ABQ8K3D6_9APHY|nr:cytochrome P450 [Rhodofomes roseus]KAH9831386.1 cytochrome P450 [Rhodofomes roseus]